MLPVWGFRICGTEDFRTDFPEPKSYSLRFSDKPANGFLLNNLTSRFQETAGHFFVETKTIYIHMNTAVLLILVGISSAVVALTAYILIRRILLKGQKEEIIRKAEIEAEAIRKEKIFQAKEKFLQLKSEHEQYINEKNMHRGIASTLRFGPRNTKVPWTLC